MNLKLNRSIHEKFVTGVMSYGDFTCFTLELPWKNNTQFISCIPAGLYKCKKHYSPTQGDCISVMGVTDREDILIHIGNYLKNTFGCILVGDVLRTGPFLGNSGITLKALLEVLPEEFNLEIV